MSLLLLLARVVPGFGTDLGRKTGPDTDRQPVSHGTVTTPTDTKRGTPLAALPIAPRREGKRAMRHKFENYDDRFSCPNCEEALPFDEFPQTCVECGFLVEVFLTREDALAATKTLEEDSDAITTQTYHVYGLGWVLGHTRLLLA